MTELIAEEEACAICRYPTGRTGETRNERGHCAYCAEVLRDFMPDHSLPRFILSSVSLSHRRREGRF